MSKQLPWEALKPLAARMPRVVREHEILRIAATIVGDDANRSADLARKDVLRWAQNRCGGRLPAEAWKFDSFEYFSGGRNSVGVRIQNDGSDIWAIRADDPDKYIAGRIWTTEVVVGFMESQPPRFSARLLASTPEDDLDVAPHSPGLVQQLEETSGLICGSYRISANPWLVSSDEEANRLIDMLLNKDRRLPVFILSVPEDALEDQPLLDARSLSRATLGTGHVVILPAQYTWTLTQAFGRKYSVFGGAVRAYLPGFSVDESPYAHRLVLSDRLLVPDGAAQCTRWMQSLAATESIRRTVLGRDVLAFAAIRSAALALNQQRLEREGASESEQLRAANDRIAALEKQQEDQKASLDYFDSEHQKAEARAEAAEEQARASAFRIQQLIEQIKSLNGSAEENITLPESWGEFTDWVDQYLAGRVVLSPTARRSVRSPEFEDARLAARCLLWLANEGRDRRINGGEGSLREEVIEEGVRNSHCGSDQYDLNWQGQRQTADWHIKNGGNTRDPKRCLRIYYFWDAATHQIVVADMPAHRRTSAS
jgi:hypothetical protein